MQQDALRPAAHMVVAIIGGGAAGTLIALQLAARDIRTTMFDRRGAFGRGVAYSAALPWHRLNVPIAPQIRRRASALTGTIASALLAMERQI